MKSKPNIFSISYLCFFLVLPFIYSKDIIDPVLIPRQVWLTVFVFFLVIIICYQIYKEQLKADFTFLRLSLPLLLILFAVAIIISFAQSNVIAESIYILSKALMCILFFIITTYLIIQNKLALEQIIKSIFAFIIVILLFVIYQFFIFKGSITLIESTIANKNLLSSLLFLTFPFIFYSLVMPKKWKILSTFLVLSILTLFWIIQTKAVIAASLVFIGILFSAVFLKYQKINTNKRFTRLLLFTATALIILASIITIQYKHYFPHLLSTNTAHTRVLLWENTVQMIEENVVFGVGAGNWRIHFPEYGLNKFNKRVQDGTLVYQRPHNDYLWVFSELGVIGIFIYLSIFIIALYYLFRLLKNNKNWKEIVLFLSILACIVGFMLISSVDFPAERIEHQVLLFLIFSIITANYYTNLFANKVIRTISIKPSLFLIITMIPIILSLYVSINRYSGEYHTSKLYNAHRHANWRVMINEAGRAINPLYVIDPMSAPIEWYKGVALFSSGNIDKAKISFERAYGLAPYNIHVLNNLGSCYESLDEHAKAIEFYLKVLSISSEFEETLLNLSAVYYNTKEYEKAFYAIDKCSINSTDIKYASFLPLILISKLDLILNQLEDEDKIEKITELKNSNSQVIELYYTSKRKGISFDTYLINH
ncbi:MAG: hypothetical protein IIA45_08950 [Bacteroidetes bacterium]|nr:hypothetical protein [Bacteroidota bacterium]